MTVQARERLPQPYAITAAVTNDFASRSLFVRLPDSEIGYPRLLWREAFAAYSRAEESGWRGGVSPLYASALGAGDRLAYPVPGDLQMLKFHFPPGNTAYGPLISKPLYAIVTIDRGLSRFLNVRFLHRP